MQNQFHVNNLTHQKIIAAVNDWNVLWVKDLQRIISYEGHLGSLFNTVKKLVHRKILSEHREASNYPKYIFIKGEVGQHALFHGALVSRICLQFFSHPMFVSLDRLPQKRSDQEQIDALINFGVCLMELSLILSFRTDTEIQRAITNSFKNSPSNAQCLYVFRFKKDFDRYIKIAYDVFDELSERAEINHLRIIFAYFETPNMDSFNVFNALSCSLETPIVTLGERLRLNPKSENENGETVMTQV